MYGITPQCFSCPSEWDLRTVVPMSVTCVMGLQEVQVNARQYVQFV